MKKIFTIVMLAALSLTALAQNDIKRVAILETVDKEGTVPYLKRLMFRSNLTSAITNTSGYEGYDRADLKEILGEQDFQRTGMVSDADIKKIGEFTGAKYVLIAEAVIDGSDMFITAKIIDVETARVIRNSNQLMGTSSAEMQDGSIKVAADLLGVSSGSPTQPTVAANTPAPQTTVARTATSQASAPKSPVTTSSPTVTTNTTAKTADGYVDLGLSSGTLWRDRNEVCGLISYDKAMSMYGDHLPTIEQINELITECVWTWAGNGYNVIGRNNASIFLPVEGYRDAFGSNLLKKNGFYWSSTPVDLGTLVITGMSEKQAAKYKQAIVEMGGMAYCMKITSKSAELASLYCGQGFSIRLVR